jgi:nucleotide-binding universal stress UspA family protein
MEKKLLVTVSEDKAAHYSVHFLGKFMENKGDFRITLFYTAPAPFGQEPAGSFEEQASLERLKDYYMQKGRQAFSDARRELVAYGFASEKIEEKLQIRRFGKIHDIIQEAETGLYDAVLLGRRGLSFFEELLDQSVTKEILDHAVTVPLWICRDVGDKKHILVCFDGSEPSIRVLEHILFIFSGQPNQRVTVLSAMDGDEEEALRDTVIDLLEKTKFDNRRCEIKITKSKKPLSAILETIKKEDYGMVACGRSGKGKGLLSKFVMGSVSYELYKNLRDRTLCISR